MQLLNALKINGKRVLLLTNGNLPEIYKSGRNIPKMKILEADKASTYDILNNQVLLLQESALGLITKTFEQIEKAVVDA